MILAEKIAHLRIANNMSQEQLAKVLGVARQSVSKWEKGEAYPTVDKVAELTKLFRVTADDLIDNSIVVNAHKKEEVVANGNKYFGTDGFRGESNKDLTAFHAFQVGRFLGWYYSGAQFAAKHPNDTKAKICIGKDNRRSSYMLEYAICAGITASGADAYILHVTTTPSVSYITRTEGFDCGVMITASHNVFYDNGIKVLNAKGEKLDDFVSHLIECYIDGNLAELGFESEKDLPYATREKIGSVVDYVAGRNRYIGYLIGCSASSFRDMRIALDCANGASWMIARNVFAALGAEVHTLGCEPNGLNINKDCGSTHLEKLQQYVIDNHMDVGFAFDGDVDRCLAVDEKGNVVDGDKILYILAKRTARHKGLHNNTIVSTIMSNSGLTKALKEIGINNVQTTVGDRFVYECMMKNNYWLGGEQSGHIIIKKYATTGDGILTAIKLAEEMISTKEGLYKLAEPVHLYPQLLKNVRVVDKRIVVENQAIKDRVVEINEELNGNGRILLRESGTEPVIRIMVESDNIELCNKYIDSIYTLVKKGGFLCE